MVEDIVVGQLGTLLRDLTTIGMVLEWVIGCQSLIAYDIASDVTALIATELKTIDSTTLAERELALGGIGEIV